MWFAGVSPNGIGNKLLGMVMSFHMALLNGRVLVVTDWPPTTLRTSYPTGQVLRTSSCQRLFDREPDRPPVKKCTVVACPLKTITRFRGGYTQPHWAHSSAQFLELPREWAHLTWLQWWRAITQYLIQPGEALLAGLGASLRRVTLFSSSGDADHHLKRPTSALSVAKAAARPGFGPRFAGGVAEWQNLPRPLVGVHVRVGDGCWDSKRGGCKYVRSFEGVVTRLREAGLSRGSIFLATDNATIATQALAAARAGKLGEFQLLTLREDRAAVSASHGQGSGRHESDHLLHLQLLDLALCTPRPSNPARSRPQREPARRRRDVPV